MAKKVNDMRLAQENWGTRRSHEPPVVVGIPRALLDAGMDAEMQNRPAQKAAAGFYGCRDTGRCTMPGENKTR